MALSFPVTPGARSRCAALICAAMLIIVARPARSAQDVMVEALPRGSALAIDARATIRAPLAVIWHALTDYDHLADFIPGMKESRVLRRNGSAVVVEQAGEAKVW